MKDDVLITRLLVGDIYLEMDINNEPRIVLKDETGTEWVLDSESTAYGFRSTLTEKEKSWYFDEKNRTKPVKGFYK